MQVNKKLTNLAKKLWSKLKLTKKRYTNNFTQYYFLTRTYFLISRNFYWFHEICTFQIQERLGKIAMATIRKAEKERKDSAVKYRILRYFNAKTGIATSNDFLIINYILPSIDFYEELLLLFSSLCHWNLFIHHFCHQTRNIFGWFWNAQSSSRWRWTTIIYEF